MFTSKGIVFFKAVDKPNKTFIQLLKKKVGPNRYKNGSKKTHKSGNRSNKKLKNNTSAMKKIDPGNPKKTKQFKRLIRKSFGHKKFTPLISVINLVLNLRFKASTRKKEFEESKA